MTAALTAVALAFPATAHAVTIPAGYHWAAIYTAYSNGAPYRGWRGVGGYIQPNSSAHVHSNQDFSVNCMGMEFEDSAEDGGLQQIQAGYDKSYENDDGTIGGYHNYLFYESEDVYGYVIHRLTDWGQQDWHASHKFNVYYSYWNSPTGKYVSVANIDGYDLYSGYFNRPYAKSFAQGETGLAYPEDSGTATQMGRSVFGGSSSANALWLKNGGNGWELWDTSLTGQTTKQRDERAYGYYQSSYNLWYNWLVYGPGN